MRSENGNLFKNRGGAPAYTDLFLAWWAIYPKKSKKFAAALVFDKLYRAGVLPPERELLEATFWYRVQHMDAGTELRFIPDGRKWLHLRMWEDMEEAQSLAEPLPGFAGQMDAGGWQRAQQIRKMRKHFLGGLDDADF